jgi:predicted Zn-dependent protease with MMP-like domain
MDARHWRRLLTMAESETQAVLQRLPDGLREPAATVPVMFEPWVSDDLVDTGLDPDILGLFTGDPHNAPVGTESLPPQIFLYLESIWDIAEADEEAFREEVRTTYLHELGHYLGLDEDDLEARGLE